MSKKTLNGYISGYIVVRAESLSPEKFINISSQNGIILQDVERINYTTIEFKMKYNQYFVLKKIIRNTNSKVKIVRKYGIHFTYKSMNRRKFFILGSIIFVFLIFLMSSIIWNVDVKGNKSIEAKRIYDSLGKCGLKIGVFKYNINPRAIEEKVLKDINEISIIKINFKGTRAEIEIVERTMPHQVVQNDVPTNIIASKAGIITKILSYKGQSIVKSGDLVKKNQVLISGTLSNAGEEDTGDVHAMGIVLAKTWYESRSEINLNYKYEERSGKFKSKVYYVLDNKKLYIKNSNISYKKYDKIVDKKIIKLGSYIMPFEKVTEYYYEKIEVYKKLDYNEAVNIGINNAKSEIKRNLPLNAKILKSKIDKNISTSKVKIRILYILEENIGVENKIN